MSYSISQWLHARKYSVRYEVKAIARGRKMTLGEMPTNTTKTLGEMKTSTRSTVKQQFAGSTVVLWSNGVYNRKQVAESRTVVVANSSIFLFAVSCAW